MFGSQELLVIAIVIFVLFGAAAIPKFAKGIGQAKKEFEKGLKDNTSEDKDDNIIKTVEKDNNKESTDTHKNN